MSDTGNALAFKRSPEAASADSRQRLKLWLDMLRSSRHIEHTLRERVKAEFDATLPRFDVMATLDRYPDGITMTELSRKLLVSNGNVTGIVDRLVEDGIVRRLANERDRRATLVALTDAGRDSFQAMAEAHAGWIDELLAPLSQTQIAAMADGLGTLRTVQRAAEDAKHTKKKD